MRNKYLLLGAASALMLAACSEDINQGPDNNRPAENALNLTSLNPASQAGRVTLPGQTRGQKADRLQLVAKIAPVAQAAENKWSATGIAISGGNAYVSWHSNRQAQNQATAWGGAIDVLNINALSGLEGAINPANVITGTQVTTSVKFNGIVADGSTFYLPITSYNYGAAVGRWAAGAETVDTITIPGVSANSIEINGNTLYAVSGYKGGVYSFPTSDFGAENRAGVNEVVAYSETFGGKYIDNGLVLRTDDQKMQILSIDGTVRNEGAALVSEEKQAENYTPGGEWVLVEGTEATHYGKHTMAVDGNYRYVGGGQGANGENGLRVYTGTGIAWQNGTNTTAVAVEGDYVFAATGAGLRVYEKFVEGVGLNLFAYEVLNYDENGMAADAPGTNKPEAGTDAHSCNFVAYDQESGLAFVACGQDGVYVFKLDTTVEVEKKLTGFITPEGGNTQEVEEGSDPVSINVPEAPAAADKTFVKWVDKDGNEYTPGESKNFNPGEQIEITPVYSAVVTFKDGDNQSNVTAEVGKTVPATQMPNANVPEDMVFVGWVIEGTDTPFTSNTVVEKNVTVVAKYAEKYVLIVTFDGNKPSDAKADPTPMPAVVKSESNTITIPAEEPAIQDKTFLGWWPDKDVDPRTFTLTDAKAYKAGDSFTSDQKNVTLYAIWADRVTGGGEQGGEEPKPVEPEPVGPGSGEGGDVPGGDW